MEVADATSRSYSPHLFSEVKWNVPVHGEGESQRNRTEACTAEGANPSEDKKVHLFDQEANLPSQQLPVLHAHLARGA